MKKLLIIALKFTLLLLFFVAVAIGSYALVNVMKWPWWAGACVFGGVMGLLAGVLFLRKWLLRKRERKFVKRIIDQDDQSIAAAPMHEQKKLQELQDRWTGAIEVMKQSKLRHHGNPLYVLPWYMVFGESDSGKTTAISSSRLTSILSDVGAIPGVSATRNCDWWFFEEAIILDTAGRYAIPIDESRDKEEWERFLSLLVKYRKREPLNGLIVTLPAERLLNGDEDSLNRYGLSIRQRMNELMRVLGVRFPVYVLVTKMDLVFGLHGLTDLLPRAARSQAMGLVNEANEENPGTFVDKVIHTVTERLRKLRLLLLDKADSFDPAFLLFTDELKKLRPRLKAFVHGAFEDNSYQEAPMFRGMFFSSGEQTGTLESGFLNSLPSLSAVKTQLPDTTRGLFLHDFFSKVLPRDRNIFTPIFEFLKWKLVTRNLGMAAWFLLLFFICGLLSLSYLGNLRSLNRLFDTFPQRPVFTEVVNEQVVELASFREYIEELSMLNANWVVPRMGLDTSLRAEQRIQTLFCDEFMAVIINPMDQAMVTAIGKLNAKSSEQLISEFVNLLVWRIDLIEKRLRGDSVSQLRALELPSGKALSDALPNFTEDLMIYFGQLYISYLFWNKDTQALLAQQLWLKARLAKVLGLKGADFKWLVSWVNSNPNNQSVTLRDFWGGPQVPLGSESYVPPAYTVKGYRAISDFLDELKAALRDTSSFEKHKEDFWNWYVNEYYAHWFAFADDFMEGEKQLLTHTDYQIMSTRMATTDNPYHDLLDRMKDEFLPIINIKTPPSWVNKVIQFNVVLAQYEAEQSKGIAQQASARAQSTLRNLVANIGGEMARKIEKRIEAAKALKDFLDVMGRIANYTETKEDAFKSASAFYPGGGGMMVDATTGSMAKQGNPVHAATRAINHLQSLMGSKGRGDEMFWRIVTGPLDFLTYVITMEASCELQTLWESQVLAEVAHVPSRRLRSRLFGKNGVVDKFTSGPAKPFLSRDTNGWHGQSWFGIPFPFRDSFIVLLNEGARGSQEIEEQYKVTLATLPTTVNIEAKEEPFATMLTLSCGPKQQMLTNYNFMRSQVFDWKPEECGTTTLIIQFPSLELRRSYEGNYGFAKFLREFENGVVTFSPDDFPQHKQGLKGLNATSITVGYKLQGAQPVVDILDIKPIELPAIISECW